jgi:hypothetical protein
MADDVNSLPVIAVTAAVGAVVLLIALLCNIGRGERKSETEGEIKQRCRIKLLLDHLSNL